MNSWMLMGWLGCVGADKDPHTGDSGPTGPDFHLLTEAIPGGVLLSAWTDGDAMLMVGGDMGGGPGIFARLEGDALCVEAAVTERALWWIHGDGAGNWVAVGEAGTVLLSDGSRPDVPTAGTLFGVWVGAEHTIAVGGDVMTGLGEIWAHAEGEAWRLVAGDLEGVVFKIWQDWIVGDGISGRLVEVEGSLAFAPIEGEARLLTVRGRDTESGVFAVGGLASATMLEWVGGAWVDRDTAGVGQPLNGVWTAADEDVWVAGNFGTSARWDGSDWLMPDFPTTMDHFHAAWKHGENLYFVGGNLFSAGDNHGTITGYGMELPPLTPVMCK